MMRVICIAVALGGVPSFRAHQAAEGTPKVPTSATLDPRVLDAVFASFVSQRGGDDSREVKVSPRPPKYPIAIEALLRQDRPELWKRLSSDEMKAARQAADHLVRRFNVHDDFQPYRSRVDDVTFSEGTGGWGDRRVEVYAPGYSRDRKTAIVRVIVPWSIHHGEGTFILTEKDGRWKVILREMVYYP